MYCVLYNVKYNKLESEVKKMNVLRMTNIELIRERDVLSEALESTIENRKNSDNNVRKYYKMNDLSESKKWADKRDEFIKEARRLRNQLLTVLNELSNRRLN
jgi:hypothetical protein